MSADSILDVYGVLEGTDKSSIGHGYLEYYEDFLRPLRNESFTLVEIGVFGGGSLRCWKSYFPNARIIGIDIDPNCRRYAEERIRIEIGSQDDPEFIDRIVQTERPLVVIDDGSHMAHHMITTFERIFPALRPGGYYIFEDAYMHYGREEAGHIGLSNIPLKEYCANIATSRVRGWHDPEKNFGISKYVFEQTASVTYLWQSILVRKRWPRPNPEDVLATAERAVSESGDARHWHGLSALVLSRNGDPVMAEKAARNAIAAGQTGWQVAHCLCQALERQGRMDEAIDVVVQALEREPRATRLLEWIGHAFSHRGEHATAAGYYRQAVAAEPGQPWFHIYLSKSLVQLGQLEGALDSATQAELHSRGGPHNGLFAAHKELVTSLMKSAA